MSKKISELPAKGSMPDTDEFTILDNDGVPVAERNKRVLKSVALAGYASQSGLDATDAALSDHTGKTGDDAHSGMLVTQDMTSHKTDANQHPISGVTGLQGALDAKADTASLGDAAGKDVGTTAGDVAAGNAPAAAVTAHESAFDHDNLPTTAQKAALAGRTNAPSDANRYVTEDDMPAPAGDELVGVTASDSTPGYLQGKLTSSDNSVQFSVTNPGANEVLNLQATGSGGGIGDAPDANNHVRQLGAWVASDPLYAPAVHNHDGDYDPSGSAAAVQTNLDTHTGQTGNDAHSGMLVTSDMTSHKADADQHPISGVTGLQSALNLKANTADLGGAAVLDVGTGAGDVAAGNAPAAAVTSHESTYNHDNLPTTAQKAALAARTNAPNDTNRYVTEDDIEPAGIGDVPDADNHVRQQGLWVKSDPLYAPAGHDHDGDYDPSGSAAAVQTNLDTHTGQTGNTAHSGMLVTTDMNSHKSGDDQHTIAGVTGLQSALNAKANSADLGDSATKNVGTGANDVAAGNHNHSSDNSVLDTVVLTQSEYDGLGTPDATTLYLICG